MVSPIHQSLNPIFDINDCIYFFKWFFGNVCSVGGDVPVDYEDICDDFINYNMMCRLSLSEMLIRILCVHACAHRDEVCSCM